MMERERSANRPTPVAISLLMLVLVGNPPRHVRLRRRLWPDAHQESLCLSTVENHVRNVLKKLGLRSREEVTAWAKERLHEEDQI